MTRAEYIQRLSLAFSVGTWGKTPKEAVEQAVLTARVLEDSGEAPWDEVSTDILHEKLVDIEKSLDLIANELPNAGRGT